MYKLLSSALVTARQYHKKCLTLRRTYVISRSKIVLIFPPGPSKLLSKHAILNYKVPAAAVIDQHHWWAGETPPPCNTCR